MNSFSFGERTTICGSPSEWKQLAGKLDAGQAASVVDLRTQNEYGKDTPPETPEGWLYRRLPVSGETVSEQDLDVLRREQLRNKQTIVLGPNEARGPLLVLTGEARKERRALTPAELDGIKERSKEKKLQAWLAQYLERHTSTTYSA